jgi:hypothetical protein
LIFHNPFQCNGKHGWFVFEQTDGTCGRGYTYVDI